MPGSRKRDWVSCLSQVIFCYNTTPHQVTGESPHYLMFGQEPQLPIDFLLDRVPEPAAGNVHSWVIEHHRRLQVVFDGACEWLEAAADHRKRQHDQHVRDLPLSEGQLVYLRDHAVRGRHKIQDLWSSVTYQVIRSPEEGGAVYAITPVSDLSKVRRVHRSLLKACVRKDISPVNQPAGVVEAQDDPQEYEWADNGNLMVLMPETLQIVQGMGPWGVGRPVQLEVQEELLPADLPPGGAALIESEKRDVEPIVRESETPPSSHNERVVSPLRSGRAGAGQHSNLHCLPRAAGEVLPCTVKCRHSSDLNESTSTLTVAMSTV